MADEFDVVDIVFEAVKIGRKNEFSLLLLLTMILRLDAKREKRFKVLSLFYAKSPATPGFLHYVGGNMGSVVIRRRFLPFRGCGIRRNSCYTGPWRAGSCPCSKIRRRDRGSA